MSDNDYDLKIGANADSASAEFNKLGNDAEKSAKKIQEVMREASYKMADATKEANEKMHAAFEGVTGTIEKLQSTMIAFAAVVAGGAAFKEAVSASVNMTKSANTLAKSLGITATQASILNVALDDVYLSSDIMLAANQRLTKTLGTNEAAFTKLGVATRDSNGHFKSSLDIMLDTNSHLLKFKEGIDRNIEGQKIYGKSWSEVSGILKLTNEVMNESKEKAEKLGLVVGQENVAAVAKYRAAMNDVHDVLEATEKAIGDALIPTLTNMGVWFSDVGPQVVGSMKTVIQGYIVVQDQIAASAKSVFQQLSESFAGISDIIHKSFAGSAAQDVGFFGLIFKNMAQFVIESVAMLEMCLADVIHVFNQMGNVVAQVAAVVVTAAKGRFSEAANIWSEGNKDIEARDKAHADEMVRIETDANKRIKAIWADPAAQTPTVANTNGINSNGEDGKDNKTKAAKSSMGEWKEKLTKRLETEQLYFKDSLQIELEFWKSKLALTKENSKDRAAVEHEIFVLHKRQAQDALQSDIADLKAQGEAFAAGGVERIRIAGEIAAKIGDKYGLESKEYKAALADMTKAAHEHQKQLDKIEGIRLDRIKEHSLGALDVEREGLKLKKDLGEINSAQELQALKQLEQKEYEIELKSAQDKAALITDPAEREAELNRIEGITRKHGLNIMKINDDIAKEQKSAWDKTFAPISSAFEKSMNGIIQGTLTLKKALSQMFQSIAMEFANLGVKMVVQWVSNEARKTMATAAGTQSRSMMETLAATQSTSLSAGAAIKNIMNSAYESMAGAYKAIAGIPFIGPYLAPVVAAGAFTAVAGMAGSIASAEGGYDIPRGINPVTQLHEREMVLPAKHADVIRGMAEGSGGGEVHHHHYNIKAMDSSSFKDFLKRNPSALASGLTNMQRNATKG